MLGLLSTVTWQVSSTAVAWVQQPVQDYVCLDMLLSLHVPKPTEFFAKVVVRASICMNKKKAVKLQFVTQKCKFPFAVLCIATSSIWYKVRLDHSGIRNLLG